jgi:hypothetical protein
MNQAPRGTALSPVRTLDPSSPPQTCRLLPIVGRCSKSNNFVGLREIAFRSADRWRSGPISSRQPLANGIRKLHRSLHPEANNGAGCSMAMPEAAFAPESSISLMRCTAAPVSTSQTGLCRLDSKR